MKMIQKHSKKKKTKEFQNNKLNLSIASIATRKAVTIKIERIKIMKEMMIKCIVQ